MQSNNLRQDNQITNAIGLEAKCRTVRQWTTGFSNTLSKNFPYWPYGVPLMASAKYVIDMIATTGRTRYGENGAANGSRRAVL